RVNGELPFFIGYGSAGLTGDDNADAQQADSSLIFHDAFNQRQVIGFAWGPVIQRIGNVLLSPDHDDVVTDGIRHPPAFQQQVHHVVYRQVAYVDIYGGHLVEKVVPVDKLDAGLLVD